MPKACGRVLKAPMAGRATSPSRAVLHAGRGETPRSGSTTDGGAARVPAFEAEARPVQAVKGGPVSSAEAVLGGDRGRAAERRPVCRGRFASYGNVLNPPSRWTSSPSGGRKPKGCQQNSYGRLYRLSCIALNATAQMVSHSASAKLTFNRRRTLRRCARLAHSSRSSDRHGRAWTQGRSGRFSGRRFRTR